MATQPDRPTDRLADKVQAALKDLLVHTHGSSNPALSVTLSPSAYCSIL